MREAEMADLKKSFDEVKEAATGLTSGGLMTSLQKDVSDALRIDEDKPAPAIEAPVTPTEPVPPTPETFVEAETHAAGEPLAITSEVQSQDNAAAAAEPLKDAKAS
jgi:sec-independent protein translocase protein TatB